MQPITFCNRCWGLKVGWNAKYALHCLVCLEWVPKSYKLLIFTVILSSFIFAFPLTMSVNMADLGRPGEGAVSQAGLVPMAAVSLAPTVTAIGGMLAKYGVGSEVRDRAAKAIVASSVKHNLAPELVASIMIVESRANPFAVSGADAVGIMQIHLPTWGLVAEKQGINLFKIEDNVELGARILKGYVSHHGLWEGVARYNGFTSAPGSREAAEEYVRKVQRVYGFTPKPLELKPENLQTALQ